MTRVRASFVALLAALLLVAPGGATSAHDELTGSDPEDGSTVAAPGEIVLTFSGEVGELGTQVAVTGPDGESVVDGEPVVDGTEVEQALTDDLAAGSYDVVWRVTSQDGHPISGELGFTVEAGDDATEDETADETTADETADETTADETADETTAEGTADETGVEPTTEGTDDGTQDADATADEEDTDSGGMPLWGWALIGLAVVGLLVLGVRSWSGARE